MEIDCLARRHTHNYEICSCQKKALLTEVSAELVWGVSSQDMLNSAALSLVSEVWPSVTWECINFREDSWTHEDGGDT